MRQEAIYDIIRFPVLTEKSTEAAEQNKYIFKVDVDSTKVQVKKSIEVIFNVKVKSVNIMNIKGKKKIFRGRIGRRNDYKKAIVSLMDGQSIDLSTGV